MRERLADTLDYVFPVVGEQLGVDSLAARRFSSWIRRRWQSPHAFGAYFEMVLAIENDDLEQARTLAGELLEQEPAAETEVAAIEDRPSNETARYRRLLVPDGNMALQPDEALLLRTRSEIKPFDQGA